MAKAASIEGIGGESGDVERQRATKARSSSIALSSEP